VYGRIDIMSNQRSLEEEFIRIFLIILNKAKEENRTVAKCLEGIEAIRSSPDGLAADEEKMYKRAIKIAILKGIIK
jgi:hypothetical protein